MSPNSEPPPMDSEDDDFSDCSACHGFGKRPSRRKKQKFRRRWCPMCRVHPENGENKIPGGRVREINSQSNETLACQPEKEHSQQPQVCLQDGGHPKEPQVCRPDYDHAPGPQVFQPNTKPPQRPHGLSPSIFGHTIYPENFY